MVGLHGDLHELFHPLGLFIDSPHEVELVEALDGSQWEDDHAVAAHVRCLPAVEPADPGANSDHVEHPLDLRRRVQHPRGANIEGRAVAEGGVVIGRRVIALDEQHWLAFEVGGIHVWLTRQWVILWDGDVIERHARQQLRCQSIGVWNRCAHQTDGDPSLTEVFEDSQRGGGGRANSDLWMSLVKPLARSECGVLAAMAVTDGQGLLGRLGCPAQCVGEVGETIDCPQR